MKQALIARFKSAYESPRVRNAAVLFSSRSFNSLISLAFSLLAGKLLAVEEFGLSQQAIARLFFAQALMEVGLQFSLVRYMVPALETGDNASLAAVMRASLQLKLYGTLAAVCIGVVATLSVLGSLFWGGPGFPGLTSHPDSLLMIWLIVAGGFGMSLITYLESIFVAHQLFQRLAMCLPLVGIIRILSLGAFVFFEEAALRAEHVVFAYSLAPFVASLVYLALIPSSIFTMSSPARDWQPWVKKLAFFNSWILLASFASILSDWMELHIMTDDTDLGLYGSVRSPLQGFLILLATLSSILLPRFTSLKSRLEYKAVFRRIYGMIVPVVFMLIPGGILLAWFIPWWFGREFEAAVPALYLLYPNYLLRLIFAPLGVALFALDQPRLIAIEAGLRMVSGVILNLALIPVLGITGAALASLLAQFSGWIFLVFCYWVFFKSGKFPFSSKLPEFEEEG